MMTEGCCVREEFCVGCDQEACERLRGEREKTHRDRADAHRVVLTLAKGQETESCLKICVGQCLQVSLEARRGCQTPSIWG